MPKVVIDTSGVEGRQQYTGPTPPTGLYKAVFKRGWWTKSSTQKPMLKVLFVLDTEHPDKKQFNGYPCFHNVTYEQSTMWKMKELFTALRAGDKAGIDYDDQGDVKKIGRAVPGKTWVLITGATETWQGQDRLGIQTLAPVPRQEGDEDADEEFTEDEGEATPFEGAAPPASGDGVASPEDGSGFSETSWDSTGSASDESEPPF